MPLRDAMIIFHICSYVNFLPLRLRHYATERLCRHHCSLLRLAVDDHARHDADIYHHYATTLPLAIRHCLRRAAIPRYV